MRIRDPVTGVTRLDASDFTVRVVYSNLAVVNGNGSIRVEGITPANAGAFMLPAFQEGWPINSNWEATASALPKMPVVVVRNGSVSWTLGAGQALGRIWQILVVRYS